MLTFIAFALTVTGCINWLLIGLLQYDFIAGFFGFQAAIMSRIFYVLFGIGALYLVLRVIINKGTFKIFERKKKKEEKEEKRAKTPTVAVKMEASKEMLPKEPLISSPSMENFEQKTVPQSVHFENLKDFAQENSKDLQEQRVQNDMEENFSMQSPPAPQESDSLFDEHMQGR